MSETAKARPRKKKRRAIVTVDLGEEAIAMLDHCCAWSQQTSTSTRKVTRSQIIREGIGLVYDRIYAFNKRKPEVTTT